MLPLLLHAAAARSGLAALVKGAGRRLVRVARALDSRRQVHRLGHLDERALKDIGLLHSDVVGALQMPLRADPSTLLMERSARREAGFHAWVVSPGA